MYQSLNSVVCFLILKYRSENIISIFSGASRSRSGTGNSESGIQTPVPDGFQSGSHFRPDYSLVAVTSVKYLKVTYWSSRYGHRKYPKFGIPLAVSVFFFYSYITTDLIIVLEFFATIFISLCNSSHKQCFRSAYFWKLFSFICLLFKLSKPGWQRLPASDHFFLDCKLLSWLKKIFCDIRGNLSVWVYSSYIGMGILE